MEKKEKKITSLFKRSAEILRLSALLEKEKQKMTNFKRVLSSELKKYSQSEGCGGSCFHFSEWGICGHSYIYEYEEYLAIVFTNGEIKKIKPENYPKKVIKMVLEVNFLEVEKIFIDEDCYLLEDLTDKSATYD